MAEIIWIPFNENSKPEIVWSSEFPSYPTYIVTVEAAITDYKGDDQYWVTTLKWANRWVFPDETPVEDWEYWHVYTWEENGKTYFGGEHKNATKLSNKIIAFAKLPSPYNPES